MSSSTWKPLAGDTVAAGVAARVGERVGHARAVVPAEALVELQHQRVVVDFADVERLRHPGGEVHEARVGLRAAPRGRRSEALPCAMLGEVDGRRGAKRRR